MEPQAGAERKDSGPSLRPENRLSFDFCELSADQLLESTPHSYKNDYRINKKNPRRYAFNQKP